MIVRAINIQMNTTTTIKDTARVWVFTSNRSLTATEGSEITELSNAFCRQWTAHKAALHAVAEVLFDNFLVISVDEEQQGASGCSIDAMHKFVQSIEKQFSITLFDRLRVVYSSEGQLYNVTLNEFESLFEQGRVELKTPVFNTLVRTGDELAHHFMIPLSDSWLVSRLRR
jgi:hypothetical protein